MAIRTASRLDAIEPFYVMERAKDAFSLAHSPECDPRQGGEEMVFLNIGEPDFSAAPLVREAAERCLQAGHTQYTQATGLPQLRERIAAWYGTRWGVDVGPSCIVITASASGALQLACLALFEPRRRRADVRPQYPCNRHLVAAAGARAVMLLIAPAELQAIAEAVRERGGLTGWRLGWMVLPPELVAPVEKLAAPRRDAARPCGTDAGPRLRTRLGRTLCAPVLCQQRAALADRTFPPEA